MVCSNCNKEIREGATYCEECGAPIDEPIVIKDIKQAAKPKKTEEAVATGVFFDFSGFVKGLSESPINILGLVGGIVSYLSAFLTWQWFSLSGKKTEGNLFDLGSKNHDMGLSEGLLILFAMLIVVAGISMIIISASKYIKPLKPYKNNFIIKIVPLLIVLVVFILVISNDVYRTSLDGIEHQMKEFQAIGSSNFKGGQGIGFVACMCGMLLYGASVVMAWLEEKK